MNTRKMAALWALALLCACGSAQASPIFTIDQQNTAGTLNTGFLPFNFGQTFKPTLSSLDRVSFDLMSWSGASSGYVVDVHQGVGVTGALIGTSAASTFSSVDLTPVEFDFSSSLNLTPNGVYTLYLRKISGANVAAGYTADNLYAGGAALFIDPANNIIFRPTGGDLVFSEGALAQSVPEPPSIVLVGAALAGLGLARRRRPVASTH